MNLLSIQEITKKYAAFTALEQVSIEVPHESVFGLLGPNGAGKTSLIRIITQIIAPDSGQLFFDDKPLNHEHIALMGYLPEERGLYKKMTITEQLLYLAQLKSMSRQEAMKKIKNWIEKFE